MKITISLTDDEGRIFTGSSILSPGRKVTKQILSKPKRKHAGSADLNFKLNLRAFVKAHSGGLSGPQKFTLLLARLTEGKVSRTIKRKDLQRAWNRMAGLMGTKFNGAYAIRAKDNGWVDTSKNGVYMLTDSWKHAF